MFGIQFFRNSFANYDVDQWCNSVHEPQSINWIARIIPVLNKQDDGFLTNVANVPLICRMISFAPSLEEGGKSLLERLQKLDFFTENIDQVFLEGARAGNLFLLQRFIDQDKELKLCDDYGRNALHLCCTYDHEECALEIIDQVGTDQLNRADKFGMRALHYAAQLGLEAACEKLLERGANPDFINREGETALYCLCETIEHGIYRDELITIALKLVQEMTVEALELKGKGGKTISDMIGDIPKCAPVLTAIQNKC